jgi:hypothetical protein
MATTDEHRRVAVVLVTSARRDDLGQCDPLRIIAMSIGFRLASRENEMILWVRTSASFRSDSTRRERLQTQAGALVSLLAAGATVVTTAVAAAPF